MSRRSPSLARAAPAALPHLLLLALLALLPACGADGRPDAERPPARPVSATPDTDEPPPRAPAYEVVASDLEVPWDLAFAPDGRIFLTERPGRIRVIQDGRLLPEPWARLDVTATGEAGLTALALHPGFQANGHLYVLGTFDGEEGLENRVVRLTEVDGRGTDPTVVVDGLPAARIHAGSALDFGPDGLLYVTSGDATEPALAQRPGALNGKLLRYRDDGTPAPDNPLGGPVYALGMRNPQGLDWHPSGALLASEHGPSGLPWEDGRTGHDEINRIVPDGNYGWPEVAGRGGGDAFVQPLAVWDPAIAPSGLGVYTGDAFPDWRGDAFLGALRGRQLRRVALNDDATAVLSQEALFQDELGRIRAVKMGPDGHLYFTTSNRDGRGDPAPEDDRVLRLVPR